MSDDVNYEKSDAELADQVAEELDADVIFYNG